MLDGQAEDTSCTQITGVPKGDSRPSKSDAQPQRLFSDATETDRLHLLYTRPTTFPIHIHRRPRIAFADRHPILQSEAFSHSLGNHPFLVPGSRAGEPLHTTLETHNDASSPNRFDQYRSGAGLLFRVPIISRAQSTGLARSAKSRATHPRMPWVTHKPATDSPWHRAAGSSERPTTTSTCRYQPRLLGM